MKNFNKIFYVLDLFKSPVALLFNSQQKLASKFGSFISLGIILFLLIFFFQSDLFHKKMPFTTIQTYFEKTRPDLQFTKEQNLGLAFGIQGYSNEFLAHDPSIFTISAYWYYLNSQTEDRIEGEEKYIKFCENSDLPITENTYEDLQFENSFCLVEGNFSLKGYWDEPNLSVLEIQLNRCDNTTSEVICQSLDNINEYFRGTFLTIYYVNNIIDVYNYELPIQTTFEVQYMSLDAELDKGLELFFRKAELINDDGIIFSSQKTTETFQFAEATIDLTKSYNNEFALLSIYSYNEVYSVNRRYQKFQEAIANVGGLANSLLLFGALFTYLEKEFIVFSTLVNIIGISELLKYKTKLINNNNNKKESIFLKKELEKVENSHQIFKMVNPKILPPDPFILEHYSQKKIDTKLKMMKNTNLQEGSKKKTKDENLNKISFFEFLKIKFSLPCKLTEKQKLLTEAFKFFPKEIDLIEIIQKIHEIDNKLKILLNEQQNTTFDKKLEKRLMETNLK